MFTNASGNIRRQPKSINWSYRKRGNIQRTQMKTTMKNNIFAMNTRMCAMPKPMDCAGVSKPQNGSVQPPKNNVTIIADEATMFEYSARKKSANFMELYSV